MAIVHNDDEIIDRSVHFNYARAALIETIYYYICSVILV
jgi:hypothetical protein